MIAVDKTIAWDFQKYLRKRRPSSSKRRTWLLDFLRWELGYHNRKERSRRSWTLQVCVRVYARHASAPIRLRCRVVVVVRFLTVLTQRALHARIRFPFAAETPRSSRALRIALRKTQKETRSCKRSGSAHLATIGRSETMRFQLAPSGTTFHDAAVVVTMHLRSIAKDSYLFPRWIIQRSFISTES